MFKSTRLLQRNTYSSIRGAPKSRLLASKSNLTSKPTFSMSMREPLRTEGQFDPTESDLEQQWSESRIIVAGC